MPPPDNDNDHDHDDDDSGLISSQFELSLCNVNPEVKMTNQKATCDSHAGWNVSFRIAVNSFLSFIFPDFSPVFFSFPTPFFFSFDFGAELIHPTEFLPSHHQQRIFFEKESLECK